MIVSHQRFFSVTNSNKEINTIIALEWIIIYEPERWQCLNIKLLSVPGFAFIRVWEIYCTGYWRFHFNKKTFSYCSSHVFTMILSKVYTWSNPETIQCTQLYIVLITSISQSKHLRIKGINVLKTFYFNNYKESSSGGKVSCSLYKINLCSLNNIKANNQETIIHMWNKGRNDCIGTDSLH